MILTGHEIRAQVLRHRIHIEPFHDHYITTNSYDVCLHHELIRYTDPILDPRRKPGFETIRIPDDGFLLKKNEFVLGATHETIGSDFYVPIVHARSSIARLGLFVHITADLVDIGYRGRLTLQLYAIADVLLRHSTRIAQISFWVPKGSVELYSGKYQGASGPRASEAYRDPQSGMR